MAFPTKLFDILSNNDNDTDVIAWMHHGRGFHIHDEDRFLKEIAPHHFRLTQIRSLYRQLATFGFRRMKSLPDRGGWYHEHFLRGKPSLLSRITISSRDTHHRSFTVEPDLHLMPPVSPPGDPPQPQPTQTAVNSNDDACANPIDSVDGLLSGVKKKAGMTRGLSGKKHCNKESNLHHKQKHKEGDKQARALYQYQGYIIIIILATQRLQLQYRVRYCIGTTIFLRLW
ncbi:predicted protein [Thalassiosira pseudonana CCMP1335]|uniref:HSF-type DNA-binding domain-containing protein n=1 Tax=Thalassiosira pseudonana TaxID=35128 RepID=B5YP17_THAPS|nr:predicted protein [Thalassiosira pseudonana CCMP1335]ACI64727.1 predicted protein [Thalassiosira pseudonana CCMP1335]